MDSSAHIGQFAGVMLVFAGGFMALYRLLARSESNTISASSTHKKLKVD